MSVTLLLASQSPRRAELLRQIGVRFRVKAVDVDERLLANEAPADYVLRLARSKGRCAVQHCDGSPVLAADTCIAIGEDIFGKPTNKDDAADMLTRLSGKVHQVYSGVCLFSGGQSHGCVQRSDVTFRQISRQQMYDYWATGEPQDKAGGYAIQGLGAVFVQHLTGSYSGVMGLPLYETAELLKTHGIDCFDKF